MSKLKNVIEKIVETPETHAKWLNTLSFMENIGARKISAAEHKSRVDLIMLKHAAEEARHAFMLKQMISKVLPGLYSDYRREFLLAPNHSFFYLSRLDVEISRYLKKTLKLQGYELKYAAYLLVTYAIEVRADELYLVYQEVLKKENHPISVKFIILEEEGHLKEMKIQLEAFDQNWKLHAEIACDIEYRLFLRWVHALEQELVENTVV